MTERVVGQTGAGGVKNAKMTPSQWSEAILLWKQGDHTLKDLSQKYGVSVRRLQEKFAAANAKKGDLVKQRHAAQEAAIVLEPSETAKRIFDTKNETYLHLTAMRRLVTKLVMETQRDNKRVSTIASDLKAIKDAASTIEICREGVYRILGLDKEVDKGIDLPALEIRGLNPDEILELQSVEVEDAAEIVAIAQREIEDAMREDDGDPP